MTASTHIDDFHSVLANSDAIETVQRVGGYLSVRVHSGAPKLNEGGIAKEHGWVIVAVDFDSTTVLLAPIVHLDTLDPVRDALDKALPDDQPTPEAGGPQ